MMFEISKRFSFAAAHHLPQLLEGHKCRRPHGHNYVVEVVLQAQQLDDFGFVLDYGELAPFRHWLMENCDHQDLNEVFDFQPTAERLAQRFWAAAQLLGYKTCQRVGVSETPDTWAWYVRE